MKGLIISALICLLSINGHCQSKSKEQRIQTKIDEAIALYKYPTDPKTGKITYERTVDVPGASKATLFKRLVQFISTQNYGRLENIKCRNNTFVMTAMFDKDILYKDADDGKLSGNGFVHLQYSIRAKYDYALIFKYKLSATDGAYKYYFTDFRVLEFLSAPKSKSRGGGMGTAVGGAVFTSSGGTTTFSAASMTQEDLEDFILHSVWQNQDAGHNEFIKQVKMIIGELKDTMIGEF